MGALVCSLPIVHFHDFLAWNDSLAQAGPLVVALRFLNVDDLLEFRARDDAVGGIYRGRLLLEQFAIVSKSAFGSKSTPSFSVVPEMN